MKIPSYLPEPFTKQATVHFNSITNLIFLTNSILSANTDAVVCLGFVFWKELQKCTQKVLFVLFSKQSLFSNAGILCTPLFFWLR